MSRRHPLRRWWTAIVSAIGAAPLVASLATATAPSTVRWDGQQTLTLGGSGFDDTVTAYANGFPLTTTKVSSSAATAVLPRTYLWEVGAVSITVKNASTAESSAKTITVTQPTWLHAEWRADKGRTMNGSTVQQLLDQSGKGDANRHLTQLTIGAQPLYVATDAAYNNQATLQPDGGDNLVSGTWTSPPAQPTRHYRVGHMTSAAGAVFFDGIAGTNRQFFYRPTTTTTAIGAASPTVSTSAWDGTTKAVVALEYNGASSKIGINAKSFVTTGTTGTNTLTGLTEFSNYTGSSKITGTFAHHLIVDSSALTTAQHNEIMDYLGSRYGVTIGL